VTQWQAELDRQVRRMRNAADMASSFRTPKLGQAPRRESFTTGTARLYRYESPRTQGTPVLFVPNVGISRPYIFDLLPGASFIEHMTQQGFDFYLLDWGWRRRRPRS
jgi:polyhydroxyalkanoate synthase subunit PhaC